MAKSVKASTVILHSRADDVVPFADSEDLVRNSGLPVWTLIEVGSDHRLADPESLETMLEACVPSDDDKEIENDAAANLLEKDWSGDCYGATMNWISLAEERDWIVVHGTVWSVRCGKRIDHAWCERGESVVDLTMPTIARIIERGEYYRIVKAEVRKKYSAEDALVLSLKNGHQGPWDEAERRRDKLTRPDD